MWGVMRPSASMGQIATRRVHGRDPAHAANEPQHQPEKREACPAGIGSAESRLGGDEAPQGPVDVASGIPLHEVEQASPHAILDWGIEHEMDGG